MEYIIFTLKVIDSLSDSFSFLIAFSFLFPDTTDTFDLRRIHHHKFLLVFSSFYEKKKEKKYVFGGKEKVKGGNGKDGKKM